MKKQSVCLFILLSAGHSVNLMCRHVIKCGFIGLQRCKFEPVCAVGSQVASREVAHRLDRLRGMLFMCGVRPPALC